MCGSKRVSQQTVSYRVRYNIIQYLECASSPSEQRQFEKNIIDGEAPGSVPHEMIEQWSDQVHSTDVTYRKVDMELYSEPIYSEQERAAIEKFHAVWNHVADNTPEPMPWSIDGLIGTPVWQEFVDGAADALQVFMNRGYLLHLCEFDRDD